MCTERAVHEAIKAEAGTKGAKSSKTVILTPNAVCNE